MYISNHLKRWCDTFERDFADFFRKFWYMFSHHSFYFIVFFLSYFCECDLFFSSIRGVFSAGDISWFYHTIDDTREIPLCRMMITPEVCHGVDCATLGYELFDDAKLYHGDITFGEENFLYKEMNSMACLHQRFKKIHDLIFCWRWFFCKKHIGLVVNSLHIKQYLQYKKERNYPTLYIILPFSLPCRACSDILREFFFSCVRSLYSFWVLYHTIRVHRTGVSCGEDFR